jgi:1-acyl-sn-glycerol-3-phosphate acyltransferase
MPPTLVTESSYQFIPPHEGRLWPSLLAAGMPWFLRRRCGITSVEVRGTKELKSLIDAGHGLLLAPNHCRMSDALVLQRLGHKLRQPMFVMASSHLFRGNRLLAFVLRRLGAFSVYREGIDRKAVQQAIDILVDAKRPLVVFPEGALSQANDRLGAIMEGVSFIARAAAKKLERQASEGNRSQGKKVYVVPVAIRYLYKGDLEQTVAPMLADIESRLSWQVRNDLPVIERIYRVGPALLTLKELEYLGQPQSGTLDERLQFLINHLLVPLEEEWLDEAKSGAVVGRVKELRKAVLPNMIESDLDDRELDRRWQQLKEMALAQQLSLYPPKYVADNPSVDRILETVDRFTEHLSGDEVIHSPMSAIIDVGRAIEVRGKRERGAPSDPVLTALEESLSSMLETMSTECTMYQSEHD